MIKKFNEMLLEEYYNKGVANSSFPLILDDTENSNMVWFSNGVYLVGIPKKHICIDYARLSKEEPFTRANALGYCRKLIKGLENVDIVHNTVTEHNIVKAFTKNYTVELSMRQLEPILLSIHECEAYVCKELEVIYLIDKETRSTYILRCSIND